MPRVYILCIHAHLLSIFFTWLCKKSLTVTALSTLQNDGHIVQNRLSPPPFCSQSSNSSLPFQGAIDSAVSPQVHMLKP